MIEVSSMLVGMAVASQIVGKLAQVAVPWLLTTLRMRKHKGRPVTDAAGWFDEKHQVLLQPYDVDDDVFKEYNFVMIQLGYIVLFAPAFPIASLVSYLSFLVEIRSDAFKLLAVCQRPRYRGAQDIGSWVHVIEGLAVASVVTNVLLIGYTSSMLTRNLPLTLGGVTLVTEETKLLALLALIVAILVVRAVVNCFIPNYPDGVAVERARAGWIKHVSDHLSTATFAQKSRRAVVLKTGRVVYHRDVLDA